jgi:alpha,alpha-trehalase
LAQILQDEKTTSEVPTLYISAKDKLGITYFQDLEKSLKILKLKFALGYTEEYVATLNTKPGLLALGLVQS